MTLLPLCGEVRFVTNHYMPKGWVAFDTSGLTQKEHAAVRLAGLRAKAAGEDPRIASALAAAATGKVHIIRCGPGVADAIKAAIVEQRPVPPAADGG